MQCLPSKNKEFYAHHNHRISMHAIKITILHYCNKYNIIDTEYTYINFTEQTYTGLFKERLCRNQMLLAAQINSLDYRAHWTIQNEAIVLTVKIIPY